MTKTTSKKRKPRKRKPRKELERDALELIENVERMKRESIPILPDHPPLH